MIKSNKRLEIVRSTTIEFSSMSQESCDAIFRVLSKKYTAVRVSIVNNLADLEAVVARNPDLVFLGIKYILADSDLPTERPGKIWVSAYLDDNNISYTGSNQASHVLERNKHLAKQKVKEAGLKTAPFWVIKASDWPAVEEPPFAYPLFVKPTNRGGGAGVDSESVVHDFKHLLSKVNSISTTLGCDSLVEEFLPGREFSVAILKDEDSESFLVMPIELIAPLDKNNERILSDSVKVSNTESAVEVTDEVVQTEISTLALNVFYALGARDYGRIDIRLAQNGEANFLEANLIPSLIDGYGSFPKACVLNSNIGYEAMIIRIAELGLKRSIDRYDNFLSSDVSAFDPTPATLPA
jgi:D-alanine-D-alanine ligase